MPKHLNSTRFFALFVVIFTVLVPRLAGQQGPVPIEAAGSEAIRPGDIVRLTVMRDKDLSGDFPVNQFGSVVLPLVGEYDVRQETQRAFRDKVIHALQQIRYAPDIELVVLRRVRVLGEVNEPGVYPLDPTMTLADAVAMAKGRTQLAKEGKILLRRGNQVLDADLRLDTRVGDSPIVSGDEIFIPRRSWIDRNFAVVAAGAPSLLGLVVAIILR